MVYSPSNDWKQLKESKIDETNISMDDYYKYLNKKFVKTDYKHNISKKIPTDSNLSSEKSKSSKVSKLVTIPLMKKLNQFTFVIVTKN